MIFFSKNAIEAIGTIEGYTVTFVIDPTPVDCEIEDKNSHVVGYSTVGLDIYIYVQDENKEDSFYRFFGTYTLDDQEKPPIKSGINYADSVIKEVLMIIRLSVLSI